MKRKPNSFCTWLRTANGSHSQEEQVPRNRDRKSTPRTIAPYLSVFVAVSVFCVAEATAQAGASQQPDERDGSAAVAENPLGESIWTAVAAARRHLEPALASTETHIRSDALREARTLHEPWIAEIVLPLCDAPDLIERNIALEAVASSNPEKGREVFLYALTSGERTVRLRGLLGLEKLGDPSTIPEVVTIMFEDPDPDLRAVAARTLGAVESAHASVSLYEALQSEFPPVREQAALSLLEIGDDELGEYLLTRLRNNENPGEVNLLRMLALIPDPSLVPLIQPYLNNGSTKVRTSAAAAIFEILERSGYVLP